MILRLARLTSLMLRLAPALVGLWLACAGVAVAGALPTIAAHSDTDFTVYAGDHLTLTVEAAGDGIAIKWLRTRTIFCRESTCAIDTKAWGVGYHKVVLVVYNETGSQSFTYHVHIVDPPAGHRPVNVKPKLVTSQAGIESVSAYDLSVHMLAGHGYSYHQKKLQVVGPVARALDWSESLRTQAKGVLEFGRLGAEAHILPHRSAVKLLAEEGGRRAILLKRGTVRSRNLSSKDPRWAVLVEDWLQVDTDAAGDVLVTRGVENEADPDLALSGRKAGEDGGDESADTDAEADVGDTDAATAPSGTAVRITVLRGRARLFLRSTAAGQGDDAGRSLIVEQGTSVVVRRGDTKMPQATVAEALNVASLFVLTTPQYLPGHLGDEATDGLAFVGTPVAKSLGAATKAAQGFIAERDFIRALEALRPFTDVAKKDYAASVAVADAYAGLVLQAVAIHAYEHAISLQPTSRTAHRHLGSLYLLTRQWRDAARELEKAADADDASAADDDPNEQQLLHYDLGVAYYFSKQKLAAKSAFSAAVAAGDRQQVAASARAFLAELGGHDWYSIRLTGGLFYDSNVLRSDSLVPSSLDAGITTGKSAGYTGSFGFSLWPVRGDGGSIELYLDESKTAYLNKSLSTLAVIDLRTGVALQKGFGGSAARRAVVFEASPYLGSIAVGGQRSLDEAGMILAVGSPRLAGLRLAFEGMDGVDPLPTRVIIMDPVRWEVVQPGDRSLHTAYYDLGFKPLETNSLQVRVDLRDGYGNYRSTYEKGEDFKDLGLFLNTEYGTSIRSRYVVTLSDNQRKFPNATDNRKDSTLTVGVDWRWYFTSALFQTVGGSYEKQASTRTVNSYKRELFSYKLGLDL